MRFLQKWVPTRPACKECEQVKWARFASNFWQGCIHICLACQVTNRANRQAKCKSYVGLHCLPINEKPYVSSKSALQNANITDTAKTTAR